MDRLEQLNAAQRDAVTTLSGPLLVLAGAGTGKTRVIAVRMAELIRRGTPPERILSVTFTNKAAREMLDRTLAMLGKRPKSRPTISTFHAFCVRVLRQEIGALGYPANFSIYDRGDQETAARRALQDVKVGDGAMGPSDLINRVGQWKSAGVDPSRAADHADGDRDYLAAVAYRKYQQRLKAAGAVDFDDLLLLTNRLFHDFPEILTRQQQRFDHVQIDEYQDTNNLQFRLVEQLVAPHRNLCVVGDDDQSIYGWRGAEVEHILNFASHFPGAKVVRLVENYRCTTRIIAIANRLVSHNRTRHEKTLIAGKQSTAEVRFLKYADERAEAECLVREVKYLVEQQQVSPGDVAILFRTNEQPRLFETELRRAGVPYVLLGGQSFFDRRETRDLVAYLRAIVNPRDEPSLLRIINTPRRGISDPTVEKVLSLSVKEKLPFRDACVRLRDDGSITARAAAAIESFYDLLHEFRRRFHDSPGKLGQTLQELLERIDYRSEIEKSYKGEVQQQVRINMVDEFVTAMNEHVDRTDSPSLIGFLQDSALDGRDEESDRDDKLSSRAVRLMTLHSAKGLEFPRVFLVGLEEGLLPHRRSVDIGGKAIDEERRLCYVGITRAMDHLTVSRSETRRKYGKSRVSNPSRFWWEMTGESDVESDEGGPVSRSPAGSGK